MNRFSSAKFPSVGRSTGSAAPTAQQILDKLASVLDVQFTLSQDGTKIVNLVYQLTGLGAQLVEIPTSFTWGGWGYGSTLGGRGISPGYAWIDGVHTKVWCANDGVANLYWTADDWVTVVQDTSLFGIVGPSILNWHPPCLKYLTVNGVPCWVATSDQSGAWYYAQDIAANFNANGTLKASAWVLGTAAPHVIADIGVSSSASCMVGNHGFITRTVNWTSFTDVYSRPDIIGGIDTDRSGKWVAFERDTGVLLMSTDDGVTWTAPQAYVRSNEGDPYVAASSVIPTGSVCAGNGIWLITGASGYAYSYDGIHWTIQNNPLGSFYGVGFDGVKFYAVNPNNAGSPPPVIYQLLVSEIPAHRQLVAEKGMSVDLGFWLPFLASAGILGTNDAGAVIERQGVALDWFGLDTTPETTIPTDVGTFSWNATDKTVDLQLPDGVTLQVGQETQIIALNNTGATIPNGRMVYVSGASGNRVTIGLADADGVGTAGVIGMTTQDILNNQEGKVTLIGLVRDIDTSAFPAGSPVYLSTTPGLLTLTAPSYPVPVILAGYVSRSHAVNGSILVYIRAQPQATPLAAPYGQELFSYTVSETEGAIGQNGVINNTPSNGTRGFAFVPSGTVLISKMRIQITQTTSSNMRLGLYNASGSRVAQTDRFNPVAGINTVSLSASVTLTGGALYYMAYWTDDTTANVRFKLLSGRSTGTTQPLDQRHDPNEMPATISSGITNTQYRPWMMISG
jgi:hypothetical protein